MRAIGIDPGSRHIAITVLDLADRRIEYVNRTVIEVIPETADGTLDDDAIDRARSAASVFMFANVPDPSDTIVTVERVLRIYPRDGISSGMSSAISDTQWIGGEIASAARSMFGEHRKRVGTCGGNEWRKAIVKHKATDADVKTVVQGAIRGWPVRSNAHERDAAGVALFGAKRWTLKHGSPSPSAAEPVEIDRSYPSGPSEGLPAL